MTAVVSILFLIVCVMAIAFLHRREGIAEICRHIRKLTKVVLSFAFVCCVGILVLSSTLTYTSSYLNSVLSAEFIAEVREVLRQLFGTESVFASLQMLGAVSVFLFSFASCAFCIFGACIFFMHTELKVQGEVKEFEEKDVDLPDGICVRRFAVFSRYLI